MPSFFPFTQGSETLARPSLDSAPLLGRFRALPAPGSEFTSRRRRRRSSSSQLGLLSAAAGRGSVHIGYGTLVAAGLEAEAAAAAAAAATDSDDADADDEDDLTGDTAGTTGGRGRGEGRTRKGGASRWLLLCRAWARPAWRRLIMDLWVEPRQGAVMRLLDRFWTRCGILVVLPAAMAIAWCAIPFPQYPGLEGGGDRPVSGALALAGAGAGADDGHRVPGHGMARVRVNFWFFLFVYYGLYNLTALVWITKVFNLYSLNWWPKALGLPLTFSLILVASLAAPIPIHLGPSSRFLTGHNTVWVSWTLVVMAVPLAIAFLILMAQERHLGLRTSLSETQRIFTSSWWMTGEPGGSLGRYDSARARRGQLAGLFGDNHPDHDDHDEHDDDGENDNDNDNDDNDGPTTTPDRGDARGRGRGGRRSHRLGRAVRGRRIRRSWLPASFVRFLWFCVALFVGLVAYLLGEAYAEIYLRTLPHDSLETILYVYSWVATVHLLDLLAGWVLGVREGERVGSYPVSWIFKLYFTLTYQTYVRALYARLRSPRQFILLQALSSASLVVLTPLTMTRFYHRAITALGLCGQSYASYQKLCIRNVFIRVLAENASMAGFLGSVLVLHLGPNRDVYPYFAFDDPAEPYDFGLTFYASSVTWGCELAAALCVSLVIGCCFGIDVGLEGRLDLAVWPELLPTSVAVMVHVLQNMFFSIIRLQFAEG